MEASRSIVRVALSIESELWAWVQELCAQRVFRNETHAVEAAVQRLMDEQAYLQEQCARHRVRYEDAAFWNRFEPLRKQYSPNRRGRVWHPELRTPRQLIWFKVDAHLQAWIDKQCATGRFENPSHLVETGFRHLRQTESAKPAIALARFPFDAQALWTTYKQGLSGGKAKRRG